MLRLRRKRRAVRPDDLHVQGIAFGQALRMQVADHGIDKDAIGGLIEGAIQREAAVERDLTGLVDDRERQDHGLQEHPRVAGAPIGTYPGKETFAPTLAGLFPSYQTDHASSA